MCSPVKRIAVLIDTLNGGGAEKVCLTLVNAMRDQGIDCHLIVLKKKCSYELGEKDHIHFIYENAKTKLYRRSVQIDAAKKIKHLISSLGNFDAYFSNLDETHAIVAKANLTNCFYVIHNSVEKTLQAHRRLGPIKYWRHRKMIKVLNNKALITVSEGIKKELENGKLIHSNNITSIYNPIDIAQIQSDSDEKIAEIPNRPYIIYLGRIAKQKRIDILIQSFQQVKSDVDLVILTNNRRKLNNIIKKYNHKNKNIICHDFKQNPYPWIKQAQTLVLSSDFEGLGMVLIEALACGTAVVSTDCPHGPSEILTDELSKFLVPPGSPKKLAEAIDSSMTQGLTSPKILDKVDLSRVVSEYLKLLENQQP